MQKIILIFILLSSCSTYKERKPAGIPTRISALMSRILHGPQRKSCSLNIAQVLNQINPSSVKLVALDNVKIIQSIGEGQVHTVFKTSLEGEELAFLRFRLTDANPPAGRNHLTGYIETFEKMTDEDIDLLREITINDARTATSLADTKRTQFYPGSNLKDPRNGVAGVYLRELADISYMWQIGRMQFDQVENPFPLVRAFVFDRQGLYMGHLMDIVPGQDLDGLLKNGKLKKEVFEEVVTEVHRQLDLLQTKNLVHGDLDAHLGNIMIDLNPDGSLRKVTLIDFSFSVALFRSPGHKIERRKFNSQVRSARNQFF